MEASMGEIEAIYNISLIDVLLLVCSVCAMLAVVLAAILTVVVVHGRSNQRALGTSEDN